jgi:hypothetical protein
LGGATTLYTREGKGVVVGCWADFGSWVDYGMALPRVKIRLSAKTNFVPRVKLSTGVILLKINLKNSKMMREFSKT